MSGTRSDLSKVVAACMARGGDLVEVLLEWLATAGGVKLSPVKRRQAAKFLRTPKAMAPEGKWSKDDLAAMKRSHLHFQLINRRERQRELLVQLEAKLSRTADRCKRYQNTEEGWSDPDVDIDPSRLNLIFQMMDRIDALEARLCRERRYLEDLKLQIAAVEKAMWRPR